MQYSTPPGNSDTTLHRGTSPAYTPTPDARARRVCVRRANIPLLAPAMMLYPPTPTTLGKGFFKAQRSGPAAYAPATWLVDTRCMGEILGTAAAPECTNW